MIWLAALACNLHFGRGDLRALTAHELRFWSAASGQYNDYLKREFG